VYKAMFLTCDIKLRKAHLLSKILFTASIVVAVIINPEKTPLLLPVLLLLGVVGFNLEWVFAATVLTGLVGCYLAISAYLLSLTGLYNMSLLQVLLVALRAITIGYSIILVFNIISPIDLYNALRTLGARRFSTYIILLWRLIPLGLRSFIDSLAVGYLKREKTTSRIPPATASVIEAGWLIEEYSYWRLRVKSKTHIPLPRSLLYTVTLYLTSIIILILVKIL